MIPHSFSGTLRLHREARLCHMSPERPNVHPAITATNEFFASMLRPITDFIRGTDSKQEALRKQTEANLYSSIAWVKAFQRADILTAAKKPIGTPTVPITAEDILLSMNPGPEREAARDRFLRATLTENMIRAAGSVSPEKLLQIAARVTGADERPSTLDQYAQYSFAELYSPSTPGVFYEDFHEAVKQIKKDSEGGVLPPPTETDYADPDFLLAHTRPSRFRGWLQVMLARDTAPLTPGNPDQAQRRKNVTELLQSTNALEQERSKKLTADLSQERDKLNQLDTSIDEGINQRNRTFMQNFGTLQPWQQFAIVGLGAYAMYRMWKSKSTLINAIPVAVLGTYLYLRLVKGDQNAVNTMSSTTQKALAPVGDFFRTLGTRTGLTNPDVHTLDQQRLTIMGQYLDKKAFARAYPNALPFLTLSEVPADQVATALKIDSDQNGHVSTSLKIEGGPLASSLEGIVTRRKYDRGTVFGRLKDDNSQISGALATVFYHLAAREPKNRNTRAYVEAARKSSALPNQLPYRQEEIYTPNDERMHASYDMIQDPAARAKYVDLVREGISLAQSKHRGKEFHQLIAELMEQGPEVQPDLADHISPEQREQNFKAEHAVNALDRTAALNPQRNKSRELIRAKFAESLEKRLKPVLTADAYQRLQVALNRIMTNNTSMSLLDERQFLDRLEYTVLVAAFRNNGTATIDDINEILGNIPEREFGEEGYMTKILGSIANWFNRNIVSIDARFNDIHNLDNILSILDGKIGTGVEGGTPGFKILRAQIIATQQRFAKIRQPTEIARLWAASLDQATIDRFGGEEAVRAFAKRITNNGPTDSYFVNLMKTLEQISAQEYAKDLVEAMMVTHRSNGNHLRTERRPEWTITPIEEMNIARAGAHRDELLIGEAHRPLKGSIAVLAMQDLLASYDPAKPNKADFDPSKEESRLRAVNHCRQISILYMGLQPLENPASVAFNVATVAGIGLGFNQVVLGGVAGSPVDTHLRARVMHIATEFISHLSSQHDENDKKALISNSSYKNGAQDIADTLRLLNCQPQLVSSMKDIANGATPAPSGMPGTSTAPSGNPASSAPSTNPQVAPSGNPPQAAPNAAPNAQNVAPNANPGAAPNANPAQPVAPSGNPPPATAPNGNP